MQRSRAVVLYGCRTHTELELTQEMRSGSTKGFLDGRLENRAGKENHGFIFCTLRFTTRNTVLCRRTIYLPNRLANLFAEVSGYLSIYMPSHP